MKTYKETIREMAERVWDNEMGGGQGRIEPGMVPFIFDKSTDTVFRDIQSGVQTVADEYRANR